jgi:DNA-binding transcriptional ArsR family regulator
LIDAGLKDGRCERCGIESWRGLPLSLQLHHANGIPDDNRLENLLLLCPNCHSQTPSHSRKRASAGSTQVRRGPRARPGVTRKRVAELLAGGASIKEAARQLGLSKSTVSWHAAKLGRPRHAQCALRYDWAAVQAFYDAGHTPRECCERFGFNRSTWAEAVRTSRVIVRPRKEPLCDLLVSDSPASRLTVKRRLLSEGMKAHRCDGCGLEAWNGRPLRLELHHVNGDGRDHRLANLRLLCPNCHSQTPNFAARALALRRTA